MFNSQYTVIQITMEADVIFTVALPTSIHVTNRRVQKYAQMVSTSIHLSTVVNQICVHNRLYRMKFNATTDNIPCKLQKT
jgi:hypothetical protein